ncbi:ABC transporter G family member 18-like [Dorcoceras hygrometricum]|nr:ABC transporter G family member 18-like [Dorcoceras hygrometricum]
MTTSVRSPFNSNRISQNMPCHGVIRKPKKDDLKYFSRQAIRCEILAIMGPVDGRKSTINPERGSGSRQYVTNEAAFTPRFEMSPDSCYASFHVISSLIVYMTLFSFQYYFMLEAMTQYIFHFTISINNFWSTLYASLVKVMFFFGHPTLALKVSKTCLGNEQGLLPHNPDRAKTRKKQRKMTLEKVERSCRLIVQDILCTIDAQRIEDVCIGVGVAMAWRVLYGLFFYVVHRFYSKKDRE